MTFYGQLDSLNDDYIIADCGLIATFICFDCNEVKAEIGYMLMKKKAHEH